MRRHLRTAALLLALPFLLDCRKAVQPTNNGDTVGAWKLPDIAGAPSGEHRQSFTLATGPKIDITFTTGTIAHDGATLRVPLTATVVAADTAGTMISTTIGPTPLHFAGDPLDQRSLDIRVMSMRDTSGCAGSSFTSESTILRLAGDGTAKQVVETAAGTVSTALKPGEVDPTPPPVSTREPVQVEPVATPTREPVPVKLDAPPAT